MRMPHRLHSMTLTEEILETDIPIFNLELLDNHSDLSPLCLINEPKPTLIDLRLQLQLVPLDLNIGVELSVLCDSFQLQLEVGLGVLC